MILMDDPLCAAPHTLPQQTQNISRVKNYFERVFSCDSFRGLREDSQRAMAMVIHCCFTVMVMAVTTVDPVFGEIVKFLFHVFEAEERGGLQASLAEVARHDIDRWPLQNFTQFPPALELHQTFSPQFLPGQNSCKRTRHPFFFSGQLSAKKISL